MNPAWQKGGNHSPSYQPQEVPFSVSTYSRQAAAALPNAQ